ncbi:MAG: sensor histidine kinase [Saprospiraceae bacterium]
MKKSIIVGLHIGFWLCYVFLTMMLVAFKIKGEEPMESRIVNAFMRIFFFTFIPSTISFYSFYFLVFSYIQQKKNVRSIVYVIVISIGTALLGTTLMYIVFGADSLTVGDVPAITGVIFMSFVALIIGILALVIKGFITWFDEIKLKEELKQKNHEMELALVKSQLDPHFLFNTLNNIDILILKDATEASNYLNKLSDIMRFMLFETKTDKILLAKEIEYIEKYIALQKIRTANSNYINFKVTGTPSGQTIAPMVFIPFIENAFKHTTNKKLENAIRINILIKKDTIKLECKNKFNPNRRLKQENNGLGNELIEKRLKLIYPEKHILEVVNGQEQYSVSLTIHQ